MEENYNNSAEKTLTTMASIVLICGIIVCVILGLAFLACVVGLSSYAFVMLASIAVVLFSTLVPWSIMKVLVNMSLTLKDISCKLATPTQMSTELAEQAQQKTDRDRKSVV